jgi:transcriptional regulator with XRE-family HTH domain
MVKTLGQHIRELRDAADLSLRECAAKLEISPAFLSDIELGRRYPSERVLAIIAKLLRTSTEDLMRYDTRPPVEELRRRAAENPTLGVLLRSIADGKVSTEDAAKFLKRKTDKDSKP